MTFNGLKFREMKWYQIPYAAMSVVFHIFVLLLSILLAKYFLWDNYDDIKNKYDMTKVLSINKNSLTVEGVKYTPISMYTFNTTEERLLKTQWTCNSSHMIPGKPRITLAHLQTSVSFPWVPFMSQNAFVSEYDSKYSRAYKMQSCMTTWLNVNKNRFICASSYNFGSSTKAIVIVLNKVIKVLWDVNVSSALNMSKRDNLLNLKVTDIVDSRFVYTIAAPRRIKVNYTEIANVETFNHKKQYERKSRQIILTNLEAHCVWAYS